MNQDHRCTATGLVIVRHDAASANSLTNFGCALRLFCTHTHTLSSLHLLRLFLAVRREKCVIPHCKKQAERLFYTKARYQAGSKTTVCSNSCFGVSTTGVPYVRKLSGRVPPQ